MPTPTPQQAAKLDQRYVPARRRIACGNCAFRRPVLSSREYARWIELTQEYGTFTAPAPKRHVCTRTFGAWFEVNEMDACRAHEPVQKDAT